jgi:hypothetical protein
VIQFWPREDERRRAAERAAIAHRAPTPEREAYLRSQGTRFESSEAHLRAGFLAEEIVDRWLTEQSIPHVRNGGPDDLPDFEIGPVEIAVKNRVGRMRGDVRFTWATKQALRAELIFTLADRDDGSIWIAGAIAERAFERARGLIRRGEDLAPGYPAQIDNWTILASQLDDPVAWLQGIYVAHLQFA